MDHLGVLWHLHTTTTITVNPISHDGYHSSSHHPWGNLACQECLLKHLKNIANTSL